MTTTPTLPECGPEGTGKCWVGRKRERERERGKGNRRACGAKRNTNVFASHGE
jgi:hypothetical protein